MCPVLRCRNLYQVMIRPFKAPKRSLCLSIGLSVTLGVVLLLQTLGGPAEIDRLTQLNMRNWEFDKTIRFKHWDNGQVCRHPVLPVNDPEISKLLQTLPKLKCDAEKDWVDVIGSTANITDQARAINGDITCSFTDILRNNEYTTRSGLMTQTHTQYHLEASDFVQVDCKSDKGNNWRGTLAGVRHSQEIVDRAGWEQLAADSIPMNVLMLGMDSISRNMFERKLPKSLKVLKELFGALVLEGYNILGDGTPQALIPMLTGQTELELPETRKRKGRNAQYVDVYPFIWNEFRNNGYVTAYIEDMANIGTFQYRLKGFKNPPVDHYGRTFYLAAESNFYNDGHCIGSLECHMVMLKYTKNFWMVYRDKPRFMLTFMAKLSHDTVNNIGMMDDDFANWLTETHSEGLFNDTLLIVMSDHGARFSAVRQTVQGKQEERLPFYSFSFPSWFKQRHPNAYANFKTNIRRLTTPFDIHATLKSILHLPPNLGDGDITQRNISLFNRVPLERSCADAQIEAHWCACLEWQVIDKNSELALSAAKHFVEFINRYTAFQRKLCEPLKLDSVEWAAILKPNKNLLRFSKAADYDGFVPELSSKLKASKEMVQVKVATSPGNGLFEASLTHDLQTGNFSLRILDVSRINKYGLTSHCIQKTEHDLRKYCYCKKQLP